MTHGTPPTTPHAGAVDGSEYDAGDAVLIGGGGRAILLQLAYPAIGRAISEHSNFAADPMRRLRHTLRYVYVVVFGTDEQRASVVTSVNSAHARVVGSGYSAADPELQLWVAATLYDTAIKLHAMIYGELTPAAADQVYADYAALGTALQVPESMWPESRAAFAEYFDGVVSSTLSVAPAALAASQELLRPRRGPLWMKAGMPLARLVTAGLLPASVRSEFGMPWNAGRERRFARAVRFVRVVYPRLPSFVRHAPRDQALRGVR